MAIGVASTFSKACQTVPTKTPSPIDAGGAHHETGPAVGQLHDAGPEHVQHNADEYVRGFRVLDDQEADSCRRDIKSQDEPACIDPHFPADQAETESHTERGDDQSQQP